MARSRRSDAPQLVAEVESGDRRRGLEALRRRLAEELSRDGLSAREVAQVAGRLQAVLADLEALPQARKGTALDELEQRRKAREAARAAAGVSGADVSAGVAARGRSGRR